MELNIKEFKKNKNIFIDDDLLDENNYKNNDYTVDGLPTIEKQLKDIEIINEELNLSIKNNEKIIYEREMKQRVKCISLHKMGLNIMTNTLNLNKKLRNKLQEIMYSYNDIEHNKIIDEFNIIVNDTIYEDENFDYSKLPIYNIIK